MKILLSWILDHIENAFNVDMVALAAKFNTHTAEIEAFSKISFDKELFELALCSINGSNCKFLLPSGQEIALPARTDCLSQCYYLINKTTTNSNYQFTPLNIFSQDKDSLFPAVFATTEDFISGAWKKFLPKDDYILDVDNKSLTNRPDMWGHRGFAREVAFLLNLNLRTENSLLDLETPTQTFNDAQFNTPDFSFKNLAPLACSAFSITKMSGLTHRPSSVDIAIRLALVGQKPITALVDLTNYVMNDWGHPVHAFDADKISNGKVIVRFAHQKEQLTILGNTMLDLTDQDLVVAGESQAISLAGIKGGLESGITSATTSILFEAANFKPDIIRKSSLRQKTRTDSSARFEKTLDSFQITNVVRRFIKLAKQYGLVKNIDSSIYLAGNFPDPVILEVKHSFLETFSGLPLTQDSVIAILTKLEFKVTAVEMDSEAVYKIEVPSFRATKNIRSKEDVLEEITRCTGFDKIAAVVPPVTRKPYDVGKILKLRSIKKHLAYGAQMLEQANYAFYDEDFLRQIKHVPESCLEIINPVSTNNYRMIKSLIPGLLKNVNFNQTFADNFRFFEVAKVWPIINSEFLEQKVLATVWVYKKKSPSFYQHKEILANLFDLCGKKISWQKTQPSNPLAIWEDNLQAADLLLDGISIGKAGALRAEVLLSLGLDLDAKGFYCEVLIDPLLDDLFASKVYTPISKYQGSYIDVSMFVENKITAAQVEGLLENSHELITKTSLIDMFEKKNDQSRSLTFRLQLQSQDRSIEKEDLDTVSSIIKQILQKPGIKIRA